MFSTNGKGLARRPAGNQLDAVLPFAELDMTHVLVEQAEMMAHRTMPVFGKGLARVLIALNQGDRLKARFVQSERQSASTGKKLNCVHLPILLAPFASSGKSPMNQGSYFCGLAQRVLPNSENSPRAVTKQSHYFPVPRFVSSNFCCPKALV